MTFTLTALGFIGTYTILLGGLLWKAAKFLSSVLKTGAKKTWKWIKGKQRRAPSTPSVGTPAAKDNRNLTDLKADLLKEQIAKLKFQNQAEQRRYIGKEEIARELPRIIHQFKSVLYGALENELPPILEGMKAADIQVKMRGALAEAFRTIETDKWQKVTAKK